MMSSDYYYTIEKPGAAEFKDRGSKFIGFAFPIVDVADFKNRLQRIKEEHPKAAHYCFAYRLGNEGTDFRSSDDREPPGSAGKPILGQIDSKLLTNVAVVVVRYFGGTLLGIPGLINAYKTSASLALQTIPTVRKAVEILYRLEFDYTKMNEVMVVLKKFNCSVVKQTTELFCRIDVGVPKRNEELVVLKLSDVYGLQMEKTANKQ